MLHIIKRFLQAVVVLAVLGGLYLGWNIWMGELRLKTPYGTLEHNYRGTDTSTLAPDGPYLRYRNGYVLEQRVELLATGLTATLDSVPEAQRLTQRYQCTVASTADTFSFLLHPKHQLAPSHYRAPARFLVLSDIEGNFKALRALLAGTGVVDKGLHWKFGTGHVVLVGDIFDRGLEVTECLWLLYRLEQEASQAGGQVHYILGNHEEMNLRGDPDDLRYKYKAVAQALHTTQTQLYGSDTELGRWLRTKNVVEKIGPYLFVHGGISPAVIKAGLSLDEINRIARQGLGRPRLVTLQQGGTPELIFGREGPMWYRGMAQQQLAPADVKAVLQQYQVARVIIGHTLQERITPLYGGSVIAIDLPHAERIWQQQPVCGLWIEQQHVFEINQHGERQVLAP